MSSKQKEHSYGTDALLIVSKLVADHMTRATKCCPNCEHFEASTVERCRLNGLRPPASIIAFGCELFENNDLPF